MNNKGKPLSTKEIKNLMGKIDKCMCQKAGDMDVHAANMAYAAKQYAELKSLQEFLILLCEYPNDKRLNDWLHVKDSQDLHRKIIEHFKTNDRLDDIYSLL